MVPVRLHIRSGSDLTGFDCLYTYSPVGEIMEEREEFDTPYPEGEIMEEREEFDTSYPDLFPGYPADLKTAKDLAEFVRLLTSI